MRSLWVVAMVACSKPAPAPAPIVNAQPAVAIDAPLSPLALTGIEPEKGDLDGGTYVRILGRGFLADGPVNVKVYFGTRQGTVVRFASDTELIVEAPGGKDNETVDVLLIFEGKGQLELPRAFTFINKAP